MLRSYLEEERLRCHFYKVFFENNQELYDGDKTEYQRKAFEYVLAQLEETLPKKNEVQ